MRIIKKGDPITKRFKCDECGCIFEAGITEYNKHQYFDIENGFTNAYTCECPYCGNKAKEDKSTCSPRVVRTSNIRKGENNAQIDHSPEKVR